MEVEEGWFRMLAGRNRGDSLGELPGNCGVDVVSSHGEDKEEGANMRCRTLFSRGMNHNCVDEEQCLSAALR